MGSFIWQWRARFWKRAARKGVWGEAGDDQPWKLCARWDRAEEMQGGSAEYHIRSQQLQGESPQRSHSKQHRAGLSGFTYIDIHKSAFSQRIVLGQHSIPKGGKAGLGWSPREGRMPITANSYPARPRQQQVHHHFGGRLRISRLNFWQKC